MKDTSEPPPPKPGLHLNWQDWLPYLEDKGASEDDKRQFIETLWAIAMGFADAGWDIRSDSAPEDVTDKKTCGQVVDLTTALRNAVLNSETHPQTKQEKETP